jgi:hypothetical protein
MVCDLDAVGARQRRILVIDIDLSSVILQNQYGAADKIIIRSRVGQKDIFSRKTKRFFKKGFSCRSATPFSELCVSGKLRHTHALSLRGGMKTIPVIAIAACLGLASCIIDSGAGPEYYKTVSWIAQDTKIFKRHYPSKEYQYAITDGLGAAGAYRDIDVSAYDVVAWIKTYNEDVSDNAAMVAGHFLQHEIAMSRGLLTADGAYEALRDGIKEGFSGLSHEQYQLEQQRRFAQANYWLTHHYTQQQIQADLRGVPRSTIESMK